MLIHPGMLRRAVVMVIGTLHLSGIPLLLYCLPVDPHLQAENTTVDKERIVLLNQRAHELSKSDPDSAIICAETALNTARILDDSLLMAESWHRIGMVHKINFRLDEARRWLLKAYAVYREKGNPGQTGRLANEIGITHGMQGNYEQAEAFFQEALEASISEDNKTEQAKCLSNLGNVSRYKGDYVSSVNYYERSRSIYTELGDSTGIAQSYNHMGIIFDYQGNYTRSLDYYFKALRILEKTADTGEIATVLGNIGVAYHLQNDHEKALEYASRQLELERQRNDKRGLSIVLNNIGQYLEDLGRFEEALAFHRESLDYKKELGLQEGIATSYHNMGNIHSRLGRYPEALKYQEISLEMREKIGNLRGISMSCISLASVYRHLDQLQNSNRYALRAIEIAEKLGTPQFMQAASRILADNYADLAQYNQAFRYQALYQEMTDSLVDAENIKRVTQLEMQYDFDKQMQEQAFRQEQERIGHESEMKKQKILTWSFIGGFILVGFLAFFIYRGYAEKKKANRLLGEQKEEIQSMNEQLQENLDEKEALLKEIHHRVKNNLQIISSLLSLQSRNLEDKAIQAAVKEGQSRVKSMALIHQMLYQSEQLNRIAFQDYLQQLALSLSDTYRSGKYINCEVAAGEIEIDIDTAIPLGLIVNELVSNAYKYAFPGNRNGLIQIIMNRTSDTGYQLAVRDNGIGVPPGLDPEKNDSLGLRLVSMLTRQLNGEMTILNENGTVIIINFTEAAV